VGLSGSVTLTELGIVEKLTQRGTKVINQYLPSLTREESLRLRKEGAQADYFLASPNAIAESGELIFLSAFGNRIAGVSNAKNVILVAGINKITQDVASALKRSREVAAPQNCRRLNYASACFAEGVCRENICFTPDYKRMCSQVLIIEAEIVPGRLSVIVVNEQLGY
jgi:acyl-CoA hydrolase